MRTFFLIAGLIFWVNSLAQIDKTKEPLEFFNGTIVRSYAVNNEFPDHMLVGIKGEPGDAKVYHSPDSGTNWKVLNSDQPLCDSCEDVQTVCFLDDKTFLAGTWKNGLFISRDNGKTFSPIKKFPAKDIRSVVRAPMGTLFVATTSHGILASEDSGKTWKNTHDAELIDELACWKLCIAPKSNNILYALTFDNGVYKSINSGETWDRVIYEKDVMIWDLAFIENEIYAVGGSENENYLFRSYMGDKNWRKFKLNIFGNVNSLNIFKTFNDYFLLMGTWKNGIHKSYAIEYSLQGFSCIPIIEEDTTGVSQVYSNDEYVYNFTWGDGIKRFERAKECGLDIPRFTAPGNTNFDPFKIEPTCPLEYFFLRLYDKNGEEVLRDSSTNVMGSNTKMNSKDNFKKPGSYIYWIKASFKDEVDTFSVNGYIKVIL
ncbi:MAG: hypothetical protein HUJ25_01070 [Crocinitomicaceae bacterium]|nr:hypothetical protein [Crocinitomicaceae bacterium]